MTTQSEAIFDSEDRCRTCNQTRGWHEEMGAQLQHPFNEGTLGAKAALPSRKERERGARGVSQVTPAFPFDPVLRQALIDKGVLSIEDIEEAERKIRTVTQAVLGGQSTQVMRGNDGQSTESTRRR